MSLTSLTGRDQMPRGQRGGGGSRWVQCGGSCSARRRSRWLWSGAAASPAAPEERGIDPHLGESLVEVQLPSKAAAVRLQLEAGTYGVDFNEHYLRRARRLGDRDGLRHRRRDRCARRRGLRGRHDDRGPQLVARPHRGARPTCAERRADAAALDEPVVTPRTHEDELVVLRADYFENYAGRFLSVEAKTRPRRSTRRPGPATTIYTGPSSRCPGTAGRARRSTRRRGR